MVRPLALLAILAASVLMDGPAAARSAGDLLIRDVRLIDGTGAPPRPGTSILVRDGRIAALGPSSTPLERRRSPG
jgi:hypothetical protein